MCKCKKNQHETILFVLNINSFRVKKGNEQKHFWFNTPLCWLMVGSRIDTEKFAMMLNLSKIENDWFR